MLTPGTLELLADFEFWRRLRLHFERRGEAGSLRHKTALLSEATARANAANAAAYDARQEVDRILEERFAAKPELYPLETRQAVFE